MYSVAREQQIALRARLGTIEAMGRRYAAEPEEWVRGATQRITLALTTADPYYVSAEVADLIAQSAKALPPSTFTRDLIPDDVSFWWFAAPMPITRTEPFLAKGRATGGVRAISWVTRYGDGQGGGFYPMTWNVGGDRGPANAANAQSVDVCFWVETASGVQPMTHLLMRFDASWEAALDTSGSGRDPDSIESRTIRRQKLAQLMAALYFIRQRVVTRRREPLDRAAIRRLPAHDPTSAITVVYLRRHHHAPRDTEGPGVEWSCRWWVGGHWRQQPCGEQRSERRPTWIVPYLKGPDDKPVRATPRVFAVIR